MQISRYWLFILTALTGSLSVPSAATAQRCCSDACQSTLLSWNAFCPETEDDDTIVTDRPDFTEASSTVGLGTTQLEIGYTFSEDDEAGIYRRTHSYPQPLLRVGILREWLELRLIWNVAEEKVRQGGLERTTVGSEDLIIGTKIALTEQCCWRPETALILQMSVPTASEFSADEVLPGMNFLYSWDINDWLSLAGNTLVNRQIDSTGHAYSQGGQSLSVGVALTDQWGTYGEWFVLYPHSAVAADADVVHFADGGFTYLLTDNLQYDVFAGVGLNDEAEDYFIGTGLSIRF